MKYEYPAPYDKWYSVADAAEALATTNDENYARTLAKEGKLVAQRFVSQDTKVIRWRIDPESVRAYNEERAAASMDRLIILHRHDITPDMITDAITRVLGPSTGDNWVAKEYKRPQHTPKPKTKTIHLSRQDTETEEEYKNRILRLLTPQRTEEQDEPEA